jgi:predicted  nucleic acid-binding Zn-ribbon protein
MDVNKIYDKIYDIRNDVNDVTVEDKLTELVGLIHDLHNGMLREIVYLKDEIDSLEDEIQELEGVIDDLEDIDFETRFT